MAGANRMTWHGDIGYDGTLDVPDDVYGVEGEWPDADCVECGHHATAHYSERGQQGCGAAWCGCPGFVPDNQGGVL